MEEHGLTNKYHELSLVKNNDKLDQCRCVGLIVSDDALTFTMTPKKGFFGIGKSKAECFTCPKAIYPSLKQEFEISSAERVISVGSIKLNVADWAHKLLSVTITL